MKDIIEKKRLKKLKKSDGELTEKDIFKKLQRAAKKGGAGNKNEDKQETIEENNADNENIVDAVVERARSEELVESEDEINEHGAGLKQDGEESTDKSSFKELGVIDILLEACEAMGFKKPTPIQSRAIPHALEGRDVLGFAATGSGKTAAFAIPVLQELYENPQPLFCCVMVPTRELAHQISQQFQALGAPMGVRTCVIIGGEDMMQQALALSRKPHVIVATPGRLLDHLEKTKGFSLRKLKFLVLDEADRLLDMDFKEPINKILNIIPKERRTFLFSATPSKDVEQLQRASLSNPVRVSVANRITTVDTLLEYYVFAPFKNKDATLVFLLNEFAGKSVIVFVNTKDEGTRIPMMLDSLNFPSIPINGNMRQDARLGALNKFRAGTKTILVATNVAARGLDIPQVDVVINYSVPDTPAEYVHRVGRTARAGRSGKAITFVSQYDLPRYQHIEKEVHASKQLEAYDIDTNAVGLLMGTIDEAQRQAKIKMAQLHQKQRDKSRKRRRNGDDKDIGNE
jgi:ATP-dependent RNA helicase DDX47/RRP3